MSETVLGQPIALRYAKSSYDPQKGSRTEFGYEGTEAALGGVISTLPAYYAWDLDNTNAPDCKLTVWIPDFSSDAESSTALVVRYELIGNDIQKTLYEHPKALALTESQILSVKRQLKNAEEHKLETPYVPPSTFTGVPLELYKLIVKGSSDFVVSQYVFKITQTVSSRYTSKVGFANVERIYSTRKLADETNPPAAMLFNLDQIDSTLKPASTLPGYAYGWLKKTPTVQQGAGGRFEIANEYWLETWSTFVYGALIP